MIERRENDRFPPGNGAYVVFSPAFTKRGPLLNLSRGGLCCIYYENDIVRPRFMDRFVNLKAGGFVLRDIPFRIVADLKIREEIPGSLKSIRQRCVKFEELTVDQVIQLDCLIESLRRRRGSKFSVKRKRRGSK